MAYFDMPGTIGRWAKKFLVVVGMSIALTVYFSLAALFIVASVAFAYTMGWLHFAGQAIILFLVAGLLAFAIIGIAEHGK
jgi:hypothetical protein